MATHKPEIFVAFPSQPTELYDTIMQGISTSNGRDKSQIFKGWPENDIAGRPLTGPIIHGIEKAIFLVADITFLNFNVTYEIGFAIGINKRAFLIKNNSFHGDQDKVSKIGIFDTLGYVEYQNSMELADLLGSNIDNTPLTTSYDLDRKAPIYLLETPYRSDALGRIISRIKKSRLQYRSFNPSEEVRMAAIEAVKHIASSHGVVIPLLTESKKDANIHNIRAAFLAGLSHGMEKPTLILQSEGGPVPIDVRDFAKFYRHTNDIDDHINSFALDVVQSMQDVDSITIPPRGKLARLSMGDPMAENEFQTLSKYYLRRDEYERTIRGEVNLVVGRKGSGKTALFSQVRNHLRKDKRRIVVDLKPEGYQLIKLREEVLDFLSEGAKSHLITAFWEYLLLLEVAYKLLEKDKERYIRDHTIRPYYIGLREQYFESPNSILGDFSERLVELSAFVSSNYAAKFGVSKDIRLTAEEVTELLHTDQIRELKNIVSAYLEHKKGVWILFDNLDKGWNIPGPSKDDIIMLRSLIDAGRKVQRGMQEDGHDFHCVVFIRNDVYQLLMKESPDFGKEMRASLDWNDSELLREMLRLRFLQNDFSSRASFQSIWNSLCISHHLTEETSQYMIDRSLMRPRNLLKILNHCKGFAVNFRHKKIEPEDIDKGLQSYSFDLLIEADQELTNIEPQAEGLIYHFAGEDWKFAKEELEIVFGDHSLPEEKYEEVINFLLYFGFLGVNVKGNDPSYIFDVGYDMKRLLVLIDKHRSQIEYVLNPAFWPALDVGP